MGNIKTRETTKTKQKQTHRGKQQIDGHQKGRGCERAKWLRAGNGM